MRFPSLKIARLVEVIVFAAASFIFSTAADAQVPTSGKQFPAADIAGCHKSWEQVKATTKMGKGKLW